MTEEDYLEALYDLRRRVNEAILDHLAADDDGSE